MLAPERRTITERRDDERRDGTERREDHRRMGERRGAFQDRRSLDYKLGEMERRLRGERRSGLDRRIVSDQRAQERRVEERRAGDDRRRV